IVDEIYRLISKKFNIPLQKEKVEDVTPLPSVEERKPVIREELTLKSKIPDILRYSKDHLWVLKLDNGNVKIGITDYAQANLGEIVFVETSLSLEGDEINAGDKFLVIESIKDVRDFFVPISGTIVSINETLEDIPESINTNPYDSWIIIIEPGNNFNEEYKALMNAADYEKLCSITMTEEAE
ncbi:MAG: glycine cleavage system protein GcvH, partial [Candidatus Hodarchaeota archaeon]